MSTAAIVSALKCGPMTTAQLLQVVGTSSAAVSRKCSGLIASGRIVRLDGRQGRGARAVYALPNTPSVPAPTTPTGAQLVDSIRARALELGIPVKTFARPLSSDPGAWLQQLSGAAPPKPHTLRRVEALLAGDTIPDRPKNGFEMRRNPSTHTLTRAPRDDVRAEPLPPTVDRDPCFRCEGPRDRHAALGCRKWTPRP